MVDILHRVGIGAPIERVYKTLTTIEGNRGWWDSNATGDAAEGGTLTFLVLPGIAWVFSTHLSVPDRGRDRRSGSRWLS